MVSLLSPPTLHSFFNSVSFQLLEGPSYCWLEKPGITVSRHLGRVQANSVALATTIGFEFYHRSSTAHW